MTKIDLHVQSIYVVLWEKTKRWGLHGEEVLKFDLSNSKYILICDFLTSLVIYTQVTVKTGLLLKKSYLMLVIRYRLLGISYLLRVSLQQ